MSQQDTDGNFVYFQYDTGDTPVGMLYNDRQYYYVTNQFGDVTAIIDEDGYIVCEYVYGDWGEILDITGDLEIAEANPLRYRGYYYDNETGYYYLQSRYYAPNICRFINADIFSLVSIDTLLGINLFAYCYNDSINMIDHQGYSPTYSFGNGWSYRIDKKNTSTKTKKHIHVFNGRKTYSQNDDGSPHDGSTGSPPKSIKKKIKENSGWDWDAKEKQYKDNQNNKEFSFDFSNLGNMVVFTLLLSICIGTGIGIIFLFVFFEIIPPTGVLG